MTFYASAPIGAATNNIAASAMRMIFEDGSFLESLLLSGTRVSPRNECSN